MTPRVRIGAFLAATAIRIVGCTWRFRVRDEGHVDDARRHAPHLIFAFWHGRMLPLSYGYRNRSIHVLASQHRDGELMGQTIRLLGFGHIRGSSTRGGARAIREMVFKLQEGFDLGITVDGPKGPRFTVKPGPLEVSKLSGSPVVPAAVSSRSHWVFRSWDAFAFPKPFTTVLVRFGPAVIVPGDAGPETLEAKRLELERVLRRMTEENDKEAALG
jgi:lysophospholipid acyltransferase (LPLAT)-like uncharacterized protein